MTSHFRVVIKNCSGHELPSKDRNGYSDPYLCFDFDHFKAFKTEIVKKSLNPKWKFEKEFYYETKYRNRLSKKKLIIHCWDWDRVGSDDYIGSTWIDLHTLAYGPIRHNLPLFDDNKPAGRIQLDIYMQEYSTVSINLRNLRLLAPNIDRDTYLEYSYTRIEDKGKKEKKQEKRKSQNVDDDSKKRQKAVTPKAKHVNSTEAHFESGPFSVQATLHDLFQEAIRIRVRGGKKSSGNKLYEGRGDMQLGQYIANYKTKDQSFFTILYDASNVEVARVLGTVTIENLPKSAQLIEGEHNEHGCTGRLLIEDMEPPNQYLVQKSTKSNPLTASDRIYIQAAHENEARASDEEIAARMNAGGLHRKMPSGTPANGSPSPLRPRGASTNKTDSDEEAENEYGSFAPMVEEADGTMSKPGFNPAGGLRPQQPPQPEPQAPFMSPEHYSKTHVKPEDRDSKKLKKKPVELPDPKTLPLPPGWDRAFDPKTGREFYKNHALHSTQWEHPEIQRMKAEIERNNAEIARAKAEKKLQKLSLQHNASQPLQRKPAPHPSDLAFSVPVPKQSSTPSIYMSGVAAAAGPGNPNDEYAAFQPVTQIPRGATSPLLNAQPLNPTYAGHGGMHQQAYPQPQGQMPNQGFNNSAFINAQPMVQQPQPQGYYPAPYPQTGQYQQAPQGNAYPQQSPYPPQQQQQYAQFGQPQQQQYQQYPLQQQGGGQGIYQAPPRAASNPMMGNPNVHGGW